MSENQETSIIDQAKDVLVDKGLTEKQISNVLEAIPAERVLEIIESDKGYMYLRIHKSNFSEASDSERLKDLKAELDEYLEYYDPKGKSKANTFLKLKIDELQAKIDKIGEDLPTTTDFLEAVVAFLPKVKTIKQLSAESRLDRF